jgi:hypothetical protein
MCSYLCIPAPVASRIEEAKFMAVSAKTPSKKLNQYKNTEKSIHLVPTVWAVL